MSFVRDLGLHPAGDGPGKAQNGIPSHGTRCDCTLRGTISIFTHEVQMLHSSGELPCSALISIPYSFAIVGVTGNVTTFGPIKTLLRKRGKGLGESVCVDELLCMLDLHIPT